MKKGEPMYDPPSSHGNALDSTHSRKVYLEEKRVGPNSGTGCRNVVLGAFVILLLALTLACGASTYSYGAPTAPTMEAQATVREASNQARGIVPVGTLVPNE